VLHTAVQSRDATATKTVIDFFMEHGVDDVNQAGDDGDTLLHLVERDSVAQELIKKRALPTAKKKRASIRCIGLHPTGTPPLKLHCSCSLVVTRM
jgi:hypothetical protein